MTAKKLTPKQQAFVDEYLKDRNATQAAIRAGYSAKTANSAAGRLLLNVGIKAAIMAATEKISEMAMVDAAWVLRNAADMFQKCKDEDDNSNALKALDMCGKHNGVKAFTQEQNTGQQAIHINFGNMADND